MFDTDDIEPTTFAALIDDPDADAIGDELLPDDDEEFGAPPPPISDTPAEPAPA